MERNRLAMGIGIGCGVLGVACCVLAVTGLIATGAFVSWVMKTPENVRIHVDSPVQAGKGDSVVIQIEVENTATESKLLDSIDISSEYLAGITIEYADPPFTESYPIPLGSDMQSYKFRQAIAPQTTLVVQFFGTAVKAGDFSGEIDICIDSGSTCATHFTRTVVEE